MRFESECGKKEKKIMRNNAEDYEMLKFILDNYGLNGDIHMMKFFIRQEEKSIHVYHADDDDVLGHILCGTVLNSPETKFIFFIEHILKSQSTNLFDNKNLLWFHDPFTYGSLSFQMASLPKQMSGQDIEIRFVKDNKNLFLRSELIRLHSFYENEVLLGTINPCNNNERKVKRI